MKRWIRRKVPNVPATINEKHAAKLAEIVVVPEIVKIFSEILSQKVLWWNYVEVRAMPLLLLHSLFVFDCSTRFCPPSTATTAAPSL